MKETIGILSRVAAFGCICFAFWWASDARLSTGMNMSLILGGILLTYPLAWLGRGMLDKGPTLRRAVWITTMAHFGLALTLVVPFVRAVVTHQDWPGWVLPVPTDIGFALVMVTGAGFLLVVANLALRGFGAPAIALSRKLAVDWLYAWTRNPMVIAALAFFLSLGVWYQSALFVLWVIVLFAPALLFFVKVFEERELEIRFGASYLEYKSRTPMLFPGRPRG